MECLQHFADDTSPFSVVSDIQSSAATLSNDLMGIINWAFQWKVIFNPEVTKQAQEIIFSRKTKKLLHLCLSFNDISLKNSMSQKHLGLTLEVKVNFVEYIKNITQKISKTIGLLRRFQPILPRLFLLTIYKTFIRSQLEFLMSSTIKLVTPPFMKNWNLFIQCLPRNNRSSKKSKEYHQKNWGGG